MYVVAVGNFVDGVALYGPFDSSEEAIEFTEGEDSDWHVVKVVPAMPPLPRDEAQAAFVTIEYEVPIDLHEFPDLTEAEMRQRAGELMAELVAQEGVQVAEEAPVRYA